MRPPAPAWAQARRILCVRLDGLTGVLLCTPAMRALREAVPGRSLTLLTSPAGAAAAGFIPELDAALAHAARWLAADPPSGPAGPAEPAGMQALAATLAARRFDAAVVFTCAGQSALPAATLCRLAGIPLRLAYCRDLPQHLPGDWIAEPEPRLALRHEVQRQLALVRHAGAPRLPGARQGLSFALRAPDLAAVCARLRRLGIDPDRPWLLLHPGAGAAARRYPAGHWARVVRLLAQGTGLPLLIVGAAADAGTIADIRAGCGGAAPALVGKLSLGELGAALHLATLALANHGGPAQLAAAVGTPVVNPYALTQPQRTPWMVRSRVLFQDVPCRFCCRRACATADHGCLAGVAPERVAAAALELLAPRRQRQPPAGTG